MRGQKGVEVGTSFAVVQEDKVGFTVLWWPMAGGQHVFMRKSLCAEHKREELTYGSRHFCWFIVGNH